MGPPGRPYITTLATAKSAVGIGVRRCQAIAIGRPRVIYIVRFSEEEERRAGADCRDPLWAGEEEDVAAVGLAKLRRRVSRARVIGLSYQASRRISPRPHLTQLGQAGGMTHPMEPDRRRFRPSLGRHAVGLARPTASN